MQPRRNSGLDHLSPKILASSPAQSSCSLIINQWLYSPKIASITFKQNTLTFGFISFSGLLTKGSFTSYIAHCQDGCWHVHQSSSPYWRSNILHLSLVSGMLEGECWISKHPRLRFQVYNYYFHCFETSLLSVHSPTVFSYCLYYSHPTSDDQGCTHGFLVHECNQCIATNFLIFLSPWASEAVEK